MNLNITWTKQKKKKKKKSWNLGIKYTKNICEQKNLSSLLKLRYQIYQKYLWTKKKKKLLKFRHQIYQKYLWKKKKKKKKSWNLGIKYTKNIREQN